MSERTARSALIVLTAAGALLLLYLSREELFEGSSRLVLIAIAGFAGIYMLVRTPATFLALYFTALLLIRPFVRIRVGPAYITELVIGAMLVQIVFLGRLQSSLRAFFVNYRISSALFVFFLAGAISLIRGYENGLVAARDSVVVFYGLLTFLVPALVRTWDQYRKFTGWILFSGIVLNVILLIQMLTQGFGASETAIPRLFGSRTSCYLFLAGSIAVAGIHGSNAKVRRFIRNFGIAQFVVVMLLSGTRSVWIACVLALVLWFSFMRRVTLSARSILRYAAVLGFFAVGLLIVSRSQYEGESMTASFQRSAHTIFNPEASPDASNRLEWWKEAVEITLRENPLFGKPFGSVTLFVEYDPKYDTYMKMSFHNSFVTILYYTGLIGLGAMLVFVYSSIRLGIRQAHRSVSGLVRNSNAALTVSFFFFCVVAFFNVILEGPQSAMPFWLIPGLLIALQNASRNAPGMEMTESEVAVPTSETSAPQPQWGIDV